MKKLLLLVLLVTTAAFAQNSKDVSTQTISASGGSVTFNNPPGSGTLTFEYTFSGTPSGVTITLRGCMQGGTCATLTPTAGAANPYVGTTATTVTVSGGYAYYTVTGAYSGAATVTVSMVGILAKGGSGGGGAPTGPAGGDLSGTYPNPTVAQVNGRAVPVSAALVGTDSSGRLVNGSSAISSVLSTGAGMFLTVADSNSCNTGVSVPYFTAWAYSIRPIIGGKYVNECRPGDMLFDGVFNYYDPSISPDSSGYFPLVMSAIGTNDSSTANYGGNTDKQNTFRRGFYHLNYFSTIPSRYKTFPGNGLSSNTFVATWTTPAGSWANDTSQGTLYPAYQSTTNGSQLRASFTSTASGVALLGYQIRNGLGGTFTVTLDGGSFVDPITGGTTFYAAGDNGATFTTTNGASKGTAALRIPFTGAGAHTIQVNVTSATSASNPVPISYLAIVPPTSSTNPNFAAMSPIHRNDVDDANSGTFAGFEQTIIAQSVSDGLNGYYANARDSLLNTNVSGVKLYVNTPTTSFTPAVWVSDTGVTYAGSGAALTKVASAPTQGQYSVSGGGAYTFNAADGSIPLNIEMTANCGAILATMFTNCYSDTLHMNDYGNAVALAVMTQALPAALKTGNNIPQSTSPFKTYNPSYLYPSQMATSNPFFVRSATAPAPGFVPGFLWQSFVNQAWFTTHTTTYGTTFISPAGVPAMSVCTYPSTVGQASNENQLTCNFRLTSNTLEIGSGIAQINLSASTQFNSLHYVRATNFQTANANIAASGTTVSPGSLGMYLISGTATIDTLNLPNGYSVTNGGCIDILATGAWNMTTAGNIATAFTAVANTPYRGCYFGVAGVGKWYFK